MNKLIVIVAIIGFCTAANIKCTEKQKQSKICTMEYMPVCGVKIDPENQYSQTFATYGNKCGACSEGVEFYAEGECESYNKKAIFCHPDDHLNVACTREFSPVCGLFDSSINCFAAPCGQNYSNKCTACINKEVTHFVKGSCEDLRV
ncbi:kazal-type proteinase inhibitor 1 (macronuclear) [Tetrahymena thermophila SB210]|uniref:Kazal-type proteinase inhibitor 1 n=1 Tax=Tetrahymena thermophila (strain SB210) TaxID=312017 RepID=I7MCF4_TETTS|nr:kazal-type proteinase inhibitor 1 [Tetrahymena thermophila SB210]EAR83794.1 kazal-type proteinase inhibitor 1 [Tetrahymena thermophila SB210]|eukprot:XP_001031457.1 kazal-type proteinase inhibitor 1 [Tetrahymena thermophila SB210]